MRVRFAPSPTGFLHLGGLRTAFFNYLLARSHPNGTFILRIEDTDQSRLVPGAVQTIVETLEWAGIKADEGPMAPNGQLYVQSQRLPIYHKFIEHLLVRGLAYKCYCPPRVSHSPGRYDRRCRSLPSSHSHQDKPFVVRFAADDTHKPLLTDLNYGQINGDQIDDIVLLKSDRFPTYHFANVVDDHEMRVDVVMRGQEWLPSTALHLALYRALHWQPPQFCHLPLLLNADRTKLSKRQDAAHVDWYRRELQCLPAALLNFCSFLGWTPSVKYGNREVLSVDELISAFDINDLNKADAIVDVNRLKWFNKQHFNAIPPSTLAQQLVESNSSIPLDYAVSVMKLMQSRVDSVSQLYKECPYFFTDPAVEACHNTYLRTLYTRLQVVEPFDNISIRTTLDSCKSPQKQEASENLKLLRHVLTGHPTGAPITDIIAVLGRITVLRRLRQSVINPN